MSDITAISWCDSTWSPWEGCTKISPGCDHCYAATRNGRFYKGANWGPGAPRRTTADWTKPRLWNAKAQREGKRLSVFPSLCDPFDNEVPQYLRTRFFGLIALTPNIDWLVLTKRIGNAARMMAEDAPEGVKLGELPNFWLGATVVNQEEADRDIPKLLATPAHLRFLSLEPLLGPVDLTVYHDWLGRSEGGMWCPDCPEHGIGIDTAEHPHCLGEVVDAAPYEGIDWVIVGGESGPGARPMHPDWARDLRDQCAAGGVPFHFKQWGEWIPYEDSSQPPFKFSQHGHEIDGHLLPDFESDDGRQQREWHCDWADMLIARRVGKKAAGRLLDGVEHNGFPKDHP